MVVKLNFDLAADNLPRLRRADSIRRLAQGGSARAHHHVIHFDTPDFALRKRGVTLLLRGQKKTWTQEIRRARKNADDSSEPLSHEWPLTKRALDLSLLKATSFRGLLKKKHVRHGLGPIFAIRFRHTVLPLALGEDCKAKLHTEIGAIVAGSRKQPICQARIELESGDPTRLFSVALDLLRSIPMSLSNRSMEERAYLLVLGTPEKPHKAARIELDRNMSRVEAERVIAANCMAQIQSNEPGFLGGPDPEYLHQLRVGWRRLRSAAAMPDSALWKELPGLLRNELRWIWGVLGAARNWDVLVDEILPTMARAAASNKYQAKAITALQPRCDRIRKRHVNGARAAIRSPRYQRLLLNIAWIVMDSHGVADPNDELAPAYSAHEFATDVLTRYRRKLKKRMRPHSLDSVTERHRARIAAKKLRYACDFFHGLFPGKATRRFLGRLESIQDALGHLNDVANCTMLIRQATASKEVRFGRVTREVVDAWLRTEEARLLIQLERARRRFSGQTEFWVPGGDTSFDPTIASEHGPRDRRENHVDAGPHLIN